MHLFLGSQTLKDIRELFDSSLAEVITALNKLIAVLLTSDDPELRELAADETALIDMPKKVSQSYTSATIVNM
jgi:hypothetical protein